ncbi:hypothetical protein C1I98_02945 [Spongiactinospora gelatinilytica]|uniref:Uncharacterized protein n=1 Tax=Spongiactinospora gelatinilytica TaxID=2666298 RepID=A0A2W2H4W4_9ACTN|nr:hypothetical protein [Spongiactinospora gelatinilytica]PZG55661.1 hypothetical protein C1I98_02945 [Spongiactinospora gelatinilytica]
MHLRKHAAALSATALLAVTAIFGAASPASASDPGCSVGRYQGTNTAWAVCSGYARYGVLIYVTHPNPNSGMGSWYEAGPCVSAGQVSEYTHNSYPFIVSGIWLC